MRIREWPWFSIVMLTLCLTFVGFVGYLIYDEIRSDRAFRERCEALGGVVISEAEDDVRICVTIDDEKRKVIIDVER